MSCILIPVLPKILEGKTSNILKSGLKHAGSALIHVPVFVALVPLVDNHPGL